MSSQTLVRQGFETSLRTGKEEERRWEIRFFERSRLLFFAFPPRCRLFAEVPVGSPWSTSKLRLGKVDNTSNRAQKGTCRYDPFIQSSYNCPPGLMCIGTVMIRQPVRPGWWSP